MRRVSLIGLNLERCKEVLGADIVKTYSVQGRTSEYQFGADDSNCVIVLPLNEIVIRVSIYTKDYTKDTDIIALLKAYSGSDDWVEDREKKSSVTRHFPGIDPSGRFFFYYETLDGKLCGFYHKREGWPSPIKIVVSNFQDQLDAIPNDIPIPNKPKLLVPFFYYKQRRFEAKINHTGEFEHFFGHSDDVLISNPSQKRLNQVMNLDVRDPKLGFTIDGLTRLPLFFCFQFEFGRVEYRVTGENEVKLIEVTGSNFSDDRPYPGFPDEFPRIPMALSSSSPCQLNHFDADVSLLFSGNDTKDFVCIVPPSPLYGVNFWNGAPKFHATHLKFLFDIKNMHVMAYNEGHVQ